MLSMSYIVKVLVIYFYSLLNFVEFHKLSFADELKIEIFGVEPS